MIFSSFLCVIVDCRLVGVVAVIWEVRYSVRKRHSSVSGPAMCPKLQHLPSSVVNDLTLLSTPVQLHATFKIGTGPTSRALQRPFQSLKPNSQHKAVSCVNSISTMSYDFPHRAIQTIGITAAGLLSGVSLSLSFILVPRLLESPSPLLLQQWSHTYSSNKHTIPNGAVVAASSFLLLSYDSYHHTTNVLPNIWKPYLLSGLLAFGVVPYTYGIMRVLTRKLSVKAEETSTLGVADTIVEAGLPANETAHAMVDKWGLVNLGRGVLLLGSAVLGTWTSLCSAPHFTFTMVDWWWVVFKHYRTRLIFVLWEREYQVFWRKSD